MDMDTWPPPMLEFPTVIRQDAITYGCKRDVPDYILVESPEVQHHIARSLQHEMGSGLVASIINRGGRAIVDLGMTTFDRPNPPFTRSFAIEAQVQPADIHTTRITTYREEVVQRKVVTHWEYFPADWICEHCGRILDGLKSPRACTQCGGPRYLER